MRLKLRGKGPGEEIRVIVGGQVMEVAAVIGRILAFLLSKIGILGGF